MKARSDYAGAVSLRVIGVTADELKLKLSQITFARKAAIVKEGPSGVWARVYPQSSSKNGALARSVGEVGAKEGWKIEELHTEEGRLDEVFRSITLPDTVKEDTK